MSETPSLESHPASAPPDQIGDAVALGFGRLVDLSAARVFGEPVRLGDLVAIPAATIDLSGGYGFGSGTDASQDKGGWSRGGGGGAGGRSTGRPVAIVEVGPDGVRVKPVLDFTKIGLTLIAAGLTVWRASRAAR